MGDLVNLPICSWYTPGIAIWQRSRSKHGATPTRFIRLGELRTQSGGDVSPEFNARCIESKAACIRNSGLKVAISAVLGVLCNSPPVRLARHGLDRQQELERPALAEFDLIRQSSPVGSRDRCRDGSSSGRSPGLRFFLSARWFSAMALTVGTRASSLSFASRCS